MQEQKKTFCSTRLQHVCLWRGSNSDVSSERTTWALHVCGQRFRIAKVTSKKAVRYDSRELFLPLIPAVNGSTGAKVGVLDLILTIHHWLTLNSARLIPFLPVCIAIHSSSECHSISRATCPLVSRISLPSSLTNNPEEKIFTRYCCDRFDTFPLTANPHAHPWK